MFSNIYGPWTIFSDLGLIFGLLLIGKLIRVKVKIVQKLFIPPSLIAGILGLALGPNGFAILPFSGQLGTYSAILIALVFGSLPLSSPRFSFREIGKRVGSIWAYAQLGMLLQWSVVGFFVLLVIKLLWPHINPGFSVMVPTGFYGGHGTAAAIGSSFESLGWDEARSLGMTTATVGVILGIVGGILLIKRATMRNDTAIIQDFSQLPQELRTGLIPREKREHAGMSTTSSISIDSLAFHLALVFFIALLGYLLSQWVKSFAPKLELPVFSCSFIAGLILKKIFDRTNVTDYICPVQTTRLGSTFTDLLVAFGVASIKLAVVVKYAIPLLVAMAFGACVAWTTAFFLGKRLLQSYWFERSIFAWGWWTGTMAIGIALLRIVDPKTESKALDDYAMAYLPIAPVEILIITFAPIMFVNGMGIWFLTAILAASIPIFILARKMGWLHKAK